MRRKLFVAFVLFAAMLMNSYGSEQVLLNSGDVYSCTFVLMNAEKVVVLLYTHRVEINATDVKMVSFENSEDELEIVLKDDTIIKGQIVEQDAEFYTIGTTAGLNTIEKTKIKEIRNPKYMYVKKADAIQFHIGLLPAYSTVLGDFASAYNTFWSGELYFEISFLKNLWIGVSGDFLMLSPQFASTNETLFLIPANVTLKYESPFVEPMDPKNLLTRLYWHFKFGLGASTIIFTEKAEARTTASVGMCTVAEYGLKYAIVEAFSIGIAGKTSIVIQSSTHVLTQSGGLFLEAKL
ncbi:MAG: hypothetical protein NT005_08790 [Spirochaetes bacterium]|nr:hypothetical protein [Spirochaetota bacterium]